MPHRQASWPRPSGGQTEGVWKKEKWDGAEKPVFSWRKDEKVQEKANITKKVEVEVDRIATPNGAE